MSEPKPFASLSSGLLARKGAAKPAMRPQGFATFGSNLEDLGWNDMGHLPGAPAEEHVPSSIAALTPAGGRPQCEPNPEPEEELDHQPEAFEDVPEPAVVVQQRALEASFAADEPAASVGPELAAIVEPDPEPNPEPMFEPEPEPAPKAEILSLPRRRKSSKSAPAGAKAAFTLRLDPERHLKLRLACAVTRRSAQQLVTGALDDLLNKLPDVQALAERVPAGQRSR